jgi:hypothetical protein
MSEDKVLCSHEVTIRFDQYDGNRVKWRVIPDADVLETIEMSLIDLAECKAPLSLMGTRALSKLCMDGLVFNALEQANSITAEVCKRLASGAVLAELDLRPKGVTIN